MFKWWNKENLGKWKKKTLPVKDHKQHKNKHHKGQYIRNMTFFQFKCKYDYPFWYLHTTIIFTSKEMTESMSGTLGKERKRVVYVPLSYYQCLCIGLRYHPMTNAYVHD